MGKRMKSILFAAMALLVCGAAIAHPEDRQAVRTAMDGALLQLEQHLARKGYEYRRYVERDGSIQLLVRAPVIKFREGDAGISAHEAMRLAEFAETVGGHPFRLLVDGHAEDSREENWIGSLSDDRALAVSEALQRYGVGDGQIIVRGLGNTQPVASNETAEGRERNRRVEITVASILTHAQ